MRTEKWHKRQPKRIYFIIWLYKCMHLNCTWVKVISTVKCAFKMCTEYVCIRALERVYFCGLARQAHWSFILSFCILCFGRFFFSLARLKLHSTNTRRTVMCVGQCFINKGDCVISLVRCDLIMIRDACNAKWRQRYRQRVIQVAEENTNKHQQVILTAASRNSSSSNTTNDHEKFATKCYAKKKKKKTNK